MTAAKKTSERVDKLRKERAALGIKRREVYAHYEDWPAVQTLAEKLQRRRAKMVDKRALTLAITGPPTTSERP